MNNEMQNLIEFNTKIFIDWPFKIPASDKELQEMSNVISSIIAPAIASNYGRIIPNRIRLVETKCTVQPVKPLTP